MNASNLIHSHVPAPDGPPRLFAMVSTAKSRAYTPHALKSFFETTTLRPNDSFVLINNDDEALPAEVAPIQQSLTLISHEQPRSFAANANLMIERALSQQADLFFMNNDIIFTDNWLAPCVGHPQTILSPISNREVQLAGSVVVVKTNHVADTAITGAPMELQEYLRSPRMFQALVEAYAKVANGLLKLIVFPFFCVRLPLAVMQRVGKFDEGFGRAGGEDYDYCLRAWLAGFDVQMAVGSYLIHFWGKSTWSAQDPTSRTPEAIQRSYNTDFLEIFKQKWGEPLFQFVLQENDEFIRHNPQASTLRNAGNLSQLVKLMMARPVDIYIA
jgi:GT2 family glycosyltransferase